MKFPKGYYLNIHHHFPYNSKPGFTKVELLYKRWWMLSPLSVYSYVSLDHMLDDDEMFDLRAHLLDIACQDKFTRTVYVTTKSKEES